MGEPLLCKYFFDFLDLCKELKLYVVVVTNFALMEQKMQERILTNYDNLDIILSLQGPTERVFPWRKEPKLTYKQWIDRMFEVIDSKFKYGFKGQIQISTLWAETANKYSICSEEQLNIFEWFSSIEEFKQWKKEFGQRCLDLATDVKHKYPENFEKLSSEVVQNHFEHYYGKNHLVYEVDKWVESEDPIQFEFLPNVHIYAKKFGLWGVEKYFKSLIPENKYVFWEENLYINTEQFRNFGVGVLSGGQVVVCPVDNEGEYVIADLSNGENYTDSHVMERWTKIQENLSISPICRRCMGRALVFDKSALNNASAQDVTHYGMQWHPEDSNNDGETRRISCAMSSVYVFPRIIADSLRVDLESIQDKKQHTLIKILSYNDATKQFSECFTFSQPLKQKERRTLDIPYKFEQGKLHRIDVITATQRDDGVDNGVAVYGVSIEKLQEDVK
jgi:hypothetical protein